MDQDIESPEGDSSDEIEAEVATEAQSIGPEFEGSTQSIIKYVLDPSAEWYRQQLTEALKNNPLTVPITSVTSVTIADHIYDVESLIKFCLDLDTIDVLEDDMRKVLEEPEALEPEVKKLYDDMQKQIIDRQTEKEAVSRKRLLAMINHLYDPSLISTVIASTSNPKTINKGTDKIAI